MGVERILRIGKNAHGSSFANGTKLRPATALVNDGEWCKWKICDFVIGDFVIARQTGPMLLKSQNLEITQSQNLCYPD
jgi:hypothetical protein